ncbi:MAG: DUF1569 domain-containing protein [Armatimonadetes bacterium]|nr:DUF1569 domain-containing protein [Armatimonadota bacterium]
MSTVKRRSLDLRDFDTLLADVDRLHAQGYDRAGSWSLGQCCTHLSKFIEKSTRGFEVKAPWSRTSTVDALSARAAACPGPTPARPAVSAVPGSGTFSTSFTTPSRASGALTSLSTSAPPGTRPAAT